MGSGFCPVAGFCDRGNEPPVYTKGWSFLNSWTTVGFSSTSTLPAASLVMRMRYDISCQIVRSPGFLEVAR